MREGRRKKEKIDHTKKNGMKKQEDGRKNRKKNSLITKRNKRKEINMKRGRKGRKRYKIKSFVDRKPSNI